jgi:hypothetical protein
LRRTYDPIGTTLGNRIIKGITIIALANFRIFEYLLTHAVTSTQYVLQ